jgi:Asp/Glu/hydantoin racemase
MSSSDPIKILVINPNSSSSITKSLESILEPFKPAGVHLEYMTGPSECPPSINDAPTSIQSAHHVFLSLQARFAQSISVDAILICCFSDHPLVAMIRYEFKGVQCIHIMEASINAALLTSSKPFAILTTGIDMVNDINRGVLAYLGGVGTRYAGCFATGLGVLELGDSSCQDKVQSVIREKVQSISQSNDVGAIILGCAGMAGKEAFIKECLYESLGSNNIAIIDGAKAGIHLLAALRRCSF